MIAEETKQAILEALDVCLKATGLSASGRLDMALSEYDFARDLIPGWLEHGETPAQIAARVEAMWEQ